MVLLGWSFFYFSDDTRGLQAGRHLGGDGPDQQRQRQERPDRRPRAATTADPEKGNNDTENSDKVITKYPTGYAVDLFNALNTKNTKVSTVVNEGSIMGELLVYVLPLLLLVGLFVMFSRMQGGAGWASASASRAPSMLNKDMPKTTFADVAGVDEAVEELHEIVDFLQNPARYQALGAKIPKGVLLFGPPGTGKTLLARAVAGEAERAVLHHLAAPTSSRCSSASAPRRVRDLFEQAKQNSPCIIFIDEIDAVGRQRGAGLGGGHDEREQTLNQMLVEMDGFERNERRHPDRGHQPARHARPGAAAAGPLRPPDPGVEPRPGGPASGPASARPRASRSRPTSTSTGWPSGPSA